MARARYEYFRFCLVDITKAENKYHRKECDFKKMRLLTHGPGAERCFFSQYFLMIMLLPPVSVPCYENDASEDHIGRRGQKVSQDNSSSLKTKGD